MTTFLLIPGAGGAAWSWHLVARGLHARGHRAVAVDLPADDEEAGLTAYARVAAACAPGGTAPLVVVGQSMGALTAPLLCDLVPVALLVLLNPMIPAPGETGGEWWEVTRQRQAMEAEALRLGLDATTLEDPAVVFGHDVPPELLAEAGRHTPDQSSRPFLDPWPLTAWPDVPTRVLVGRDDRFFPLAFQRRLARDRLGLDVDEVGGSHSAMLSRPDEVAARLDRYARELVR
ncbi:alpha/beta fold hydrolase [Ornithinimicrobium cerasi]|uniref:Alpha/beta hydrolase family protein n=1 Tax=Ornithinimicrobium cerasi TaxID=2248773 RepID=A0A285VJP3_9MICO|nr:alpha/beta hydrolase [Ornithinimicrobium cerasi]SOC54305.1 Alpha/beta hydrolase family protein [Ornithinimicrobium cerasi]